MAARAQEGVTRTIGWLSVRSANTDSDTSIGVWEGLNQIGHVEGKPRIEFRSGEGNTIACRLLQQNWCADKWKCW